MIHSIRPPYALIPLLVCLATGCGGAGPIDVKSAPYGAWTPTTKTTSTVSLAGIKSVSVAQVLGDKTVNGQTYSRYATTKNGDPADGIEFWVKQDGDTLTLAGIDGHSTAAAPLAPPAIVTLDAPITGSLTPPVGETQSKNAGASVAIKNDPTPRRATGSGSYKLVEEDVTVQTGMGTVHGCRHFSGSASVDGDAVPALFRNMPLSADAWYHPSFGIVSFKTNTPILALTSMMFDSSDCGAPDGNGYRLIRRVQVIDTAHPIFKLDSYDCAAAFDADKDTHAKMLLELRWVEDAKARLETKPAEPFIRIEFGTVFGTFPYTLERSAVSVLHPEENGEGFVYWIAFVDQAAKNEAQNGIAYHIKVQPDPSASALRASGRILYKRYK